MLRISAPHAYARLPRRRVSRCRAPRPIVFRGQQKHRHRKPTRDLRADFRRRPSNRFAEYNVNIALIRKSSVAAAAVAYERPGPFITLIDFPAREDISKGIERNPSCSVPDAVAERGCLPPPSLHTRAHAQKRGG